MAEEGDNPISTAAARDHFSHVVNRAAFGGERIVLTRRGKPIAAVVPVEDVEWLEELDAQSSPEDEKAIQEGREAFRRGETVSLDELKKEYGLD